VTPAKKAKSKGLKGLSEVSSITKQSPQTLSNWSKNKPELFDVILMGCVAVKTGNL